MIYSVSNDFLKIDETAGTIQNTSYIFDIEVSHKPDNDSGILLRPLNKYSFTDQTIYLRCIGGSAEVRVVPFTVDMGVGSASSVSSGFDSFTDGDLDDIFKD